MKTLTDIFTNTSRHAVDQKDQKSLADAKNVAEFTSLLFSRLCHIKSDIRMKILEEAEKEIVILRQQESYQKKYYWWDCRSRKNSSPQREEEKELFDTTRFLIELDLKNTPCCRR